MSLLGLYQFWGHDGFLMVQFIAVLDVAQWKNRVVIFCEAARTGKREEHPEARLMRERR